MRAERSTIRRTAIALLVALVASFALSAPADAAAKKPTRARHASRTTAGAKPAAKKKAARKRKASAKGAAAKKSAKKSTVKRKPATKPR